MKTKPTLSARNDSTCVTHTATRRSSATGDEADNGLGVWTGLVVLLEVLGGLLLHGATNFTNDNDT